MNYLLEVCSITSFSFSTKVMSSPLKSKVVSPFENASEYFKIIDNPFHTLSCKSRSLCSDSTRTLRPLAFATWNFVFSSATCKTGDSSVIGLTSSLIVSLAQVRTLSDTSAYFKQFASGCGQLDDPAQLLPELLEKLVALGDLAKQVSRALGGNGHRASEVERLMQELGAGRE